MLSTVILNVVILSFAMPIASIVNIMSCIIQYVIMMSVVKLIVMSVSLPSFDMSSVIILCLVMLT
jgi:hypothetical protein